MPSFTTRLATEPKDLRAAERLRYEVFVEELGGDGPFVDHAGRYERDEFDDFAEHLIVEDESSGAVVGVYRLMDGAAAARAGRFYSEGEYDLSALKASGKTLLELGRSCLHADYRGGTAMLSLWGALGEIVEARGVDVLIGVASFHGTDVEALSQPLSLLYHRHLAPAELSATAIAPGAQRMDLVSEDKLDRAAAMRQVPALIKAYLRLGGTVGDGAFVDHAFNTTDVCLILETAKMSAKSRAIYGGRG